MAIRLKCPHCEQKFSWQFSEKNQWPKHCPECGEYVGTDRADDDIVMPNILSPRTKNNDKLYRDMERASENRVQEAAQMAGCDASEMAGLKITNMNDRRDAEIAAMPVSNEVTRAMDAQGGQNISATNNRALGYQANGAMLSPDVMSGPAPNAGAKMRSVIHNYHQETLAKNLPGVSTDVVSERPGNETMQPGYRRRG